MVGEGVEARAGGADVVGAGGGPVGVGDGVGDGEDEGEEG